MPIDVSEKARILVIDDEPLNLEIIMHTLGRAGYDIKCLGDAEQALYTLHNNPEDFDIILLDRQLPGMDGLELLKRIKKHDKLKNLLVIMQTALGEKKQIEDGINSGAFYYLTKPFDSSQLLSIVESASTHLIQEKLRLEIVKKSSMIYGLVETCNLIVRNLEEVDKATTFLTNLFPDPEKVSFGIHELILNAHEHGNLDLGFFKKNDLKSEDVWQDEIKRREKLPENQGKFVKVNYIKTTDKITLVIEDQGSGFDFASYLSFNADRVTENHGRGVAISKSTCFDEMEYTPPGNKVTCTVLIKK